MEQHIQHCKGRIISIPPFSLYLVLYPGTYPDMNAIAVEAATTAVHREEQSQKEIRRRERAIPNEAEEKESGIENSFERIFEQRFVTREKDLLSTRIKLRRRRERYSPDELQIFVIVVTVKDFLCLAESANPAKKTFDANCTTKGRVERRPF